MAMLTSNHARGGITAILVGLALALAGCKPQPAAEQVPGRLPALGAQRSGITVSGISSGAYMAGQMQIAHSTVVTGAALIAGGPYGCAESAFADMMPGPGAVLLNASKAVNGCMLNALQAWGIPNVDHLAERTRRLAGELRIDPLDGVTGDRVYLFSGTQDHTVVPAIVAAAEEYYVRLGVARENVKRVETLGAGHAFVTEDRGGACDRSGAPYVVDCDYDQAGELLAHLLGPLRPRVVEPKGDYVVFEQAAFTQGLGDHGLAEEGIAYIPAECRAHDGCRIHVAYHGCAQSRSAVGDAFVKDTGLTRWADSNRLIVLFPQATAGPLNPQGCWDWWGYTGANYLTRDAAQIVAVKRMIDRVSGSRASS